MAEVSVTLPADLQRHIEARAYDAGLADPASYLRALAEQDQEDYRADVARVQALIDEGIASGIVDEEPEAVLRKIIAEFPTAERG